jgi:hypothetical protein
MRAHEVVAAVVFGLGLGTRLAARHPRDVGLLDRRCRGRRVTASQRADAQHQRDEDPRASVFASGPHWQSIALAVDPGVMIGDQRQCGRTDHDEPQRRARAIDLVLARVRALASVS